MANKKINQFTEATSVSPTDLIAIGDPSTGELNKAPISLIQEVELSDYTPQAGFNLVSDGDTIKAAIEKIDGKLAYINPGFYKPENYGAVRDGVTDDGAAFQAMHDDMPASGGSIILQTGNYRINTAVTFTKPFKMQGRGYHTIISTSSPTLGLLTISNTPFGNLISDVRFLNESPTIPTAGYAIRTTGTAGTNWNIFSRYENVYLNRFFDDFVNDLGSVAVWNKCFFDQPVRYGLRINNTYNPDSGDSYVSDCYFNGHTTLNSVACIRYESSGGLKVINCKFNANSTTFLPQVSIDVNMQGNTVDLLVSNSSFENYGVSAIKIRKTSAFFRDIVINGNQITPHMGNTGYSIDIADVDGVSIIGNVIRRPQATSTYFDGAIKLQNVNNAALFNMYAGYTSANPVSIISCTNVVNLNSGSGGSGGDMLSTATNNMSASGKIVFPMVLNDSQLRVGSLELQGRTVNSTHIQDNIYYDGTAYKYRATGWGNMLYFGNGGLIYFNAPSGTAAATATITKRFEINSVGDIGVGASAYINWGATLGTTGYGFRDNGGVLQYKNSGGTWLNLGTGAGGTLQDVTTAGNTTTNGITLSTATGTGRNVSIGNVNTADNAGFVKIASSIASPNTSAGVAISGRGTGAYGVMSRISLYNTDWNADQTNLEGLAITAAGATGYSFNTLKGGTGTVRDINFQVSGTNALTIAGATGAVR